MTYWCWRSHTCWVCTDGGRNFPRLHASSKGWEMISPCDTTGAKIEASSRAEALKKYRTTFRVGEQHK